MTETQFPFKTMNSQGIKALNKPITLLWLLGQYYLSEITEFSFSEVEPLVGDIIRDYTGLPNIIDPFWRLKNVESSVSLRKIKSVSIKAAVYQKRI
ncbi:MAG: hypothetical protein EH225_06245 [Calditrichaeota bacterium]|nr:MAG: hypothetical protein EH225_06245 [Calditrichota bacterium]